MKKVLFIAKTNLNNDGRILNELKILTSEFDDIFVDFILLPDSPLVIDLGDRINIHTINPRIRNNKYLRLLALLEFSFRSLILMLKLKPDIVHVQDSEVVLPVLLYKIFNTRFFYLVYDDHEIPNENQRVEEKLYTFFEVKMLKSADYVIFANEERLNLLKNRYHLMNKCSFFLNLPYFSEDKVENVDDKDREMLAKIDHFRKMGISFFIHQGPILFERGREKLAEFSKIIPNNFKILLLGGDEEGFKKFLEEYRLHEDYFLFVGSVNYKILPEYWERGTASIVMYLPTFLNNRFCAPNRFYISVQKGLPVLVNHDNPVLVNFINRYNCGFVIDEFSQSEDFGEILSKKQSNFDFCYPPIRDEQIENFLAVYKSMIF